MNLWKDIKSKLFAREIATRERSIDFMSLAGYLPNPDPILKKKGGDIAVYTELLGDAHLGACVTSRKAGVKSLEWEINRGAAKNRQAKLIDDTFKNLDMNRIISEILDAPLFGYQALEIIWERVGSYFLPKDIVGKPQEWFVFGIENELRFKSKTSRINGEPLPAKKFLLPRHNPSYQNPYGFPLLSRCFWPLIFKKGGVKFWVTFTEKYGMPFIVGKHPRGTTPKEVDDLGDRLEVMVQDAVAVIPDDSSVELKEAAGKSASAEIYEKLLNFSNSEVSKAILGQTLTTEMGKTGSYGASKTHMEVRKDLVEEDRKLTEQTFNLLIQWVYELNFPVNSQRAQFTMYEEEDVDKTLAERDKILVDSGLTFTKTYFKKAYGFDDEDIAEIIERKPKLLEAPKKEGDKDDNKNFTEGEEVLTALDTLVDSIAASEFQTQIEESLQPIFELVQKSNDFTEVQEGLVKLFPKMKTEKLEAMLNKAMFISNVWGRLYAK